MNKQFNVYCDESCHLENDQQKVMVLGALWHPLEETRQIAKDIRDIKQQYHLSPDFEIKWTKISPAGLSFYLALVDYFFNNNNLHFRALIIPNKDQLRHESFKHTHDTWYYKMYFDMLKVLFEPDGRYFIYVDIKDSQSAEKLQKLHDVLCNNMYDFHREILQRVQVVRSHEVEQIQLADLLIGAVSYANRNLDESPAKRQVIELIRKRSGYSLTRTTLLREEKVNIFSWKAQEVSG